MTNDAQKGQLDIKLLRAKLEAKNATASIRVKHKPRLSDAQKAIWAHELRHPNTATFTMLRTWRIIGKLERQHLGTALQDLVAQNDAFRMHITAEDGIPIPVFTTNVTAELTHEQIMDKEGEDFNLQTRLAKIAESAIDINQTVLFKFRLIERSKTEHILCISLHHVIADDWTYNAIAKKLSVLFERASTDTSVALIRSTDMEDSLSVQKDQLTVAQTTENALNWPIPGVRTSISSSNPLARILRQDIAPDLVNKLRAIAVSQNTSVFAIFSSAYQILFHNFCAQGNISTSVTAAVRDESVPSDAIGIWLKTIFLPSNLDGDMCFQDHFMSMHSEFLNQMSAKVRMPKSTPETSIVYYNIPSVPLELSGLQVCQVEPEVKTGPSFFHLAIHDKENGGIDLGFTARTSVFNPKTTEILAETYVTILKSIAANPAANVLKSNLLTPSQITRLAEFSSNISPYPSDKDIPTRFEEIAQQFPNSKALTTPTSKWSYRELDQRSNQIARWMSAAGLSEGDVLGVSLSKGAPLILHTLAAQKLGVVVAPLDIKYPTDKLIAMIKTADCTAILSDGGISRKCFDGQTQLIPPSDKVISQLSKSPIQRQTSDPKREAYLLFTSGSTGIPKAAAIPHQGILRLTASEQKVLIEPKDKLLQLASPSFDAAIYEIWGALLNGAELVSPNGDHGGLDEITNDLRRHQITVGFFTAGLFNLIIDEDPQAFASVRWVRTGGEAMSPAHINMALKILPNSMLENAYGPTENSTLTSAYFIQTPQVKNVPIGRPCSNNKVFVLNGLQRPVPVGFAGELYIAGDGLSLGYKGQAEENAKKFVNIDNTQLGIAGQGSTRFYKSGDRVRWNTDMQIEYLGRIDSQIKFNGFRIEPAEIVRALVQHPKVETAAVIPKYETGTQKTTGLFAFYETRSHSVSPATARNFLSDRLPQFLIPTEFFEIDTMPLTKNGKVDTQSLLEISKAAEAAHVRNSNNINPKLVEIWEDLLNRKIQSENADFFQLGGHSLLAMRMLSRVGQALDCTINVSVFLKAPYLDHLQTLTENTARLKFKPSTRVSLLRDGNPELSPLVCIGGINGEVIWVRKILDQWPDDRAVIGISIGPESDWDVLPKTLDQLADVFIQEIKDAIGDKTCHLFGYSFGGTLASVMKDRSDRTGGPVDKVIMLDSSNNLGITAYRDKFFRPYPQGFLNKLNIEYQHPYSTSDFHLIRCLRCFRKPFPDRVENLSYTTSGTIKVFNIDTYHESANTIRWSETVATIVSGIINDTRKPDQSVDSNSSAELLSKLYMARQLSLLGKASESERLYSDILDKYTDFPSCVYPILCNIYTTTKRHKLAAKLCDQLIASGNRNFQTHNAMARAVTSDPNEEIMIKLNNLAMHFDPVHLQGFFQNAKYFLRKKHHKELAKLLDEAAILNPNSVELGIIQIEQKVLDRPIVEIENFVLKVLESNFVNGTHFIYILNQFLSGKSHEMAIKVIDLALEYDPYSDSFKKLRKQRVKALQKQQDT